MLRLSLVRLSEKAFRKVGALFVQCIINQFTLQFDTKATVEQLLGTGISAPD